MNSFGDITKLTPVMGGLQSPVVHTTGGYRAKSNGPIVCIYSHGKVDQKRECAVCVELSIAEAGALIAELRESIANAKKTSEQYGWKDE